MKNSVVYLVGAGPGDVDLLTIKAKKIISNADCIIYDRLINKKILSFAKENCEIIYLGKENVEGGESQHLINNTLVQKAREHKSVVRLKGGDPFVFGRGGEEIEELNRNAINYEIIPGITSAISVPCYAGIPVTHRNVSRSFHIFTGHTMKNGNWHNFKIISQLEGTLIFLMGVKNLERIVNDLLLNGKNPETPVAIIEKGATNLQNVLDGNLKDIVAKAKEKEVKPPAVIVVGDVVKLRENFKWYENIVEKETVLITRDKNSVDEMREELILKGYDVESLALIEIEKIKIEINNLNEYDCILFNSANGVRSFFENLDDVRKLAKIKIGAVGEKTVEELKKNKIVADFVPEKYTIDELAKASVKHTEKNSKILVISSDISPFDSEKFSKNFERNFEKLTAYKTKKVKIETEKLIEVLKNVDVITFLSSSTVESLYENLAGDLRVLQNKKIASIGPVTSKTLKKFGFAVDFEAKKFTAKGLVEEISKNKKCGDENV